MLFYTKSFLFNEKVWAFEKVRPAVAKPTFSKAHAHKVPFMRCCRFLSRVAFICNLFFVLSVLLQWKLFLSNQAALSTILIAGFLLAPLLFNPLANLMYLALLISKKQVAPVVPKWLAVANFIFLLLQILFVLFFLHDPFHH
jgi:hypothetical protein